MTSSFLQNRVAPSEDNPPHSAHSRSEMPSLKLRHTPSPITTPDSSQRNNDSFVPVSHTAEPNSSRRNNESFVLTRPPSGAPKLRLKYRISDIFGMAIQMESGQNNESELSKENAATDSMRHVAREEMGRKAAAPCNFHQATLFFLFMNEGSTKKQMHSMLFLGCLLIWMQLVSALAFVYGVYNSTCSRNSDCFAGQFCSTLSTLAMTQQMCHPCVQQWNPICNKDGSVVETNQIIPILWQKSVWPQETMGSDALQKMCLACVVESSYLSGRDAARNNAARMSSGDWFVFILCLSLISLSIVNELRDIFLCTLSSLGDPDLIVAAEQRKTNKLEPLPLVALSLVPYSTSNWKIHWILFVHQCIRRYAILPVLIMAIPMLVVVQGSSGVSICLNSVGVLFILEMDNLAYQYGIHEQDRETMETEGGIYLSSGIQASLVRMKSAHLISVPLGIIATLLLIRGDVTGPYHLQIVWMLVCSLSFWAGGLVETFIFAKNETTSTLLKLVSFEVFKMVIGEIAIWAALCLLYPFFIQSFFTGSFW
jgi:hypothetical protein